MFVQELEHTSATLAAMEASHEQLGKTQAQYTDQHGLLGASKHLLRTLDWQNRAVRGCVPHCILAPWMHAFSRLQHASALGTDSLGGFAVQETYMLWFGLALFALVSFYVAQKRLLYFVPHSLRPMSLAGSALSLVRGSPPPPPTTAPPPAAHGEQPAARMVSEGGLPAAAVPPPPPPQAAAPAPGAAAPTAEVPPSEPRTDLPRPDHEEQEVFEEVSGSEEAAAGGEQPAGRTLVRDAGGDGASVSEVAAIQTPKQEL
jgi:hypothetical protein